MWPNLNSTEPILYGPRMLCLSVTSLECQRIKIMWAWTLSFKSPRFFIRISPVHPIFETMEVSSDQVHFRLGLSQAQVRFINYLIWPIQSVHRNRNHLKIVKSKTKLKQKWNCDALCMGLGWTCMWIINSVSDVYLFHNINVISQATNTTSINPSESITKNMAMKHVYRIAAVRLIFENNLSFPRKML